MSKLPAPISALANYSGCRIGTWRPIPPRRGGDAQALQRFCPGGAIALDHPPMSRVEDFRFRVEALGARAAIALFRALPIDAASWLGGALARALGPLSGAHKTAANNLALAFPEKTAAERAAILRGMWDNIGRTVAEYPHLGALMDDPERVAVEDPEHVAEQLRDDGQGALLVGMHAGNWELATVPGHRAGLKQHHFYRAPNNPYVDAMLQDLRKPLRQEGFMPKGATGARQAAMLLKNEAHIGMLVDQKQDEGIPTPFFGRDAMTTTAPAALARRLNVPVVGARVIRQQGARFIIKVQTLTVAKTGDRKADVITTTKQITALFEQWIREHPAQWFWVHRRWPRDGGGFKQGQGALPPGPPPRPEALEPGPGR